MCNAEKCKSKMQKRCRCKNTMQKNANHWSDLLFVRFFLHCFFAVFFFLLLSCFFVFLCICLGFCNFFPKSCLSSWSLVWFAFFSLSFCSLPRFFNFFPFVQLAPGLICCFFCTFLHVYFLLLSELLFSIVFFSSFFAFVLFASPASALLICMFFALFLFFPSWKFTRTSAIRQHNVYGVSFTKEERHEPPSSRQDTTKGGWELITFSTYKEPPDVDPISYIHIFLGPQPHNAHDPKIVSGCTGCK